jgi:hypothetical protein
MLASSKINFKKCFIVQMRIHCAGYEYNSALFLSTLAHQQISTLAN